MTTFLPSRAAMLRATVVTADGERRTLNLCEQDYRRLRQQQGSSSPLETLFSGRGGLLDDMFDDFWGDRSRRRGEDAGARGGRTIPVRAGRGDSAAPPLEERLSENAKELLQLAARTAQDRGLRQVDTEHLLYALASNDVVQTVGQFKVSADDLRQQIEREATRDTREDAAESGELGVTPRLSGHFRPEFLNRIDEVNGRPE